MSSLNIYFSLSTDFILLYMTCGGGVVNGAHNLLINSLYLSQIIISYTFCRHSHKPVAAVMLCYVIDGFYFELGMSYTHLAALHGI